MNARAESNCRCHNYDDYGSRPFLSRWPIDWIFLKLESDL